MFDESDIFVVFAQTRDSKGVPSLKRCNKFPPTPRARCFGRVVVVVVVMVVVVAFSQNLIRFESSSRPFAEFSMVSSS